MTWNCISIKITKKCNILICNSSMFWFSLYMIRCVCFGNIIWFMTIIFSIFLLPYENKDKKYWHCWVSGFWVWVWFQNPFIFRDLLFPPYGLLARPAQIANMPFGLYNLETPLCFLDYVFRTPAKYKRNFTPHFYSFTISHSPSSLSLSLSLSLHYPKFRTPQILFKFGVLLLKSTAFQPLSDRKSVV